MDRGYILRLSKWGIYIAQYLLWCQISDAVLYNKSKDRVRYKTTINLYESICLTIKRGSSKMSIKQ